MTEETFIKLGFERVDVLMKESGCTNDFYYYMLDIGDICIMSSANDEVTKYNWTAFIMDYQSMIIDNTADLKSLVRIFKDNTKI